MSLTAPIPRSGNISGRGTGNDRSDIVKKGEHTVSLDPRSLDFGDFLGLVPLRDNCDARRYTNISRAGPWPRNMAGLALAP